MTDPLELEESELFGIEEDEEQEHIDILLSKSSKSLVVDTIDDAASSEDDETGILDFDDIGSTDSAVPTPTAPEEIIPKHTLEMGTSIGNLSEVGSLKRFNSGLSTGGLTASLRPSMGSEGDLILGASAPTKAHFSYKNLPPRSFTPGPGDDLSNHHNAATAAAAAAGGYLGTSMPIRIPMMHRRGLADKARPSLEGRAATFVPPHLLEYGVEANLHGTGSLALSPTASMARDKLMARNNILRSTGFIEVQSFAAPVGEIIDAVKESILPSTAESGLTAPPTGGIEIKKRMKPTSSLTALLGTSK
ncbi:hypothetical protein NADE_008486 [Nannochloris sp. 'desiccata']|nr:hypothetical protein KSW81_002274 [Chlorella desiccata (nom. nud.)]KAH7623662.1 hypothetical protein NADE_008486 [Chlorella desiccata (nom. nud.)]